MSTHLTPEMAVRTVRRLKADWWPNIRTDRIMAPSSGVVSQLNSLPNITATSTITPSSSLAGGLPWLGY